MEKARIWEITDRTVRTWLSEAVEAAAADGVTFSDADYPPYVPSLLRDAYAVRFGDTSEGFAEPDGPQIDQFHGGLYEGVCARCRGTAPGAVCYAGS